MKMNLVEELAMNNKRIIILILMGFVISIFIIAIEINRGGDSEENYTEDIESIEKQLKYLSKLQKELDSTVMKDEKVRELIEEKNHLKMFEIFYNESRVVEYYWIGFEYKNLSLYNGSIMTGGKFYRFNIDLNNKTVLSVEEMKNQTLGIKKINDEFFLNDEYTSIYSLASIRTGNLWSPMENIWYHCFDINGTGEVKLVPDPPSKAKGWGCFKHYVTIKEIYNRENFHFLEDINDPDDKKVWCSGDRLPTIKSEKVNEGLTCKASYPPENSILNIINPGNWPSDAGFFYRWSVIMKQNQTIVFDVNIKFENIEDARNIDATNHYWRVIITSPPDPEKLSVEQMKEYGIDGYEATHHISINGDARSQLSCTYTHNSGMILVKQDFINAIAGE